MPLYSRFYTIKGLAVYTVTTICFIWKYLSIFTVKLKSISQLVTNFASASGLLQDYVINTKSVNIILLF